MIARVWQWLFARERYIGARGVVFYRHPNGGGWVASSATVHEDTYVNRWAMVMPNARVQKWCELRAGVVVGRRAKIAPYVYVGFFTSLDNDATVYANSVIGGCSSLGEHSTVGEGVVLGRFSHVGSRAVVGDRCIYGRSFYAPPGAKGESNEDHRGSGYVLGRGYPREMPVIPYIS